jgi:hypothetical protein
MYFYDKHTYPSRQNIEETLTVDDLLLKIKQGLHEAKKDENMELVQTIKVELDEKNWQ